MKTLKKFICFSIILLAAITFTACADQNIGLTINDNGSSQVIAKVSINKDLYNYLNDLDPKLNIEGKNGEISPLFKKSADKLKTLRYEITPINNDIEVGFQAKKEFIGTGELNNEFKILEKEKLFSSNLRLTTKKTLLSRLVSLKGDVEYAKDPDYENLLKKINSLDFDDISKNNIKMKFQVQLPGKVIKRNSKDLLYEIPYGKKEHVDVMSKMTNTTMLIALIFGVVILVGGLVLGILIYRKQKREG